MDFATFAGQLRHPDTAAPLELDPWQENFLRLLYGENPNATGDQLGRDLRVVSALTMVPMRRHVFVITTADDA